MKKTIAFQGLIGANSYLACKKFYPKFNIKQFPNFDDVFKSVENDEVDYGMIPLENSYAGRVSEIHNLLQESKVFIIAEHFFSVKHYLCAINEAKISDIDEVYSHPQALWQCKKNLQKLKLKTFDFSNTAKAAEFISLQQNKNKAAICSKEAAKHYGLKILKENLQDSKENNVTVFVSIAKKNAEIDYKKQPTITAFLITIKNTSGSLYNALGCFAENKINMIKLESYIPGGVSKKANFFISIEGNPKEENVFLAIKKLKNFTENIKILGTYYSDKKRS
jgi:prephenate dehydratase